MNKKISVISLFFLTILLFSFFSKQVSSENGDIPTDENTGKILNFTEQISTEEARSEYLKQEWGKILEKSKGGRFLLGISSIFKSFSPLFRLFVGIEYSLSWLFFLSFIFWLAIVIIIYKPITQIFQAKWWIALPISIIIPAFAANGGIITKIVNLFVPLFVNKGVISLVICIVMILMVIYSRYMKYIGKKMAEKRKKENEERREIKSKTVEKINDMELKRSTPNH